MHWEETYSVRGKGGNQAVLEISHLTKKYGNHLALSDLTCTIEEGKIYGFLGPNGAGKSTTMNIITGCLSATSGTATIDGYDIFEEPEEAKKRIGYLPELPPLYMDMTPTEYLTFVAKAKGVEKHLIREQVEKAMETTHITHMRKRICRNLSKGYKQRVGVAQSLLGDPKLIIMDEPTVGLDPKQIIEIRDLITELGKDHTVLLSSHILFEVNSVCDRVLILSHGRLVANDTPANLEKVFASAGALNLLVKGDESAARSALKSVIAEDLMRFDKTEEGLLTVGLSVGDNDLREKVFYAMAGANLPILEMNQTHISLEDVFLELTDETPADVSEPEKEVEA